MSKKFGVVDTYYSILTKGPMSGRPTYFIELSNKGERMSMKKLAKRVHKECAGHMIHIRGDAVYNEQVITWCKDNYAYLVVEIDSSTKAPEGFDWFTFDGSNIFLYVNVDSNDIDLDLDMAAMAYFYKIDATESLSPDGLPKKLHRPCNSSGIILTPANSKAYERVVQICKHYGYYLNIEYNHMIGIR